MKNMFYRLALLATCLFASQQTFAWDGVASGNISEIDTINESNNYELRVFLGGKVMCNNPDGTMNTWAYLNSSDANYKGTLANLMLAYATGKHVTIFTMNDGGAGCHIHYIAVSG